MRAKHSALILTAGFLLIPTLTWSQGPGGGRPGGNWGGGQWGGGPGGDRGFGKGGGYSPVQYGQPGGDKPVVQFGGPPGGMGGGGMGGGGRGMSRDPDQLFNMLSGGKDIINVADMNPMMKGIFDRMGPRLGLTGPTITRDQFKGAVAKGREMAASGQFGPAAMAAAAAPGGPMGFAPQMTFTPGGPGGPGGFDPDRRAEDSFNRRDKNQNGVLEYDEMPETLQNERDTYDTNHDGVIDLNEYKAYIAARRSERSGPDGTRNGPNGVPADGDERKRPTIVRAGNMPKDFPYAALDRDQDGQIGLYEWREAGRPIAEFLAMDLNNDGFLTVDEYFRWKQLQDEAIAKANGTEAGQFGAGRGRAMNPGMMVMGGGRGMGAGGNPWQGGGMMNFPGGGPRGSGGGWGRTPGELPMGAPGGDFSGRGSRMRGGPGGDTGGGRGGPGGFGRMRGGDTGGGFGPPGGGFNPQDAAGGGPRGPGGFGGRTRGGPNGDTGAPGGFGGRNRGGPGGDNGDQGQGGGRGGRRGGRGGFGRSR